MGVTDLHLEAIFAAPCPTIKSPLVLTPGFAVHYLDGPANSGLPPQLYESYSPVSLALPGDAEVGDRPVAHARRL